MAEDLDAIVAEHYRQYWGVAYRILGDRDWAEDIAQETSVRVLQKVASGSLPPSDAKRFGGEVARNLAIDEYRKRRKHRERLTEGDAPWTDGRKPPNGPDLDDDPENDSNFDDSQQNGLDLDDDLADCLGRLTMDQRTAVVQQHVFGRSYKEVAELLEESGRPTTETGAKGLIQRGLDKLRRCMMRKARLRGGLAVKGVPGLARTPTGEEGSAGGGGKGV